MTHKPDHSTQESQELQKLEAQKQLLQSDVQKLKSPIEQEKIIRNELNLQKEGETIIQLPPMPSPTPHPTQFPSPTPKPYEEWWGVVVGGK